MVANLYTIADDCPLACGPVVLIKRLVDDQVFACCRSCGMAWADPMKESWQVGDLGHGVLHACLVADSSRIAYATAGDIERAGLMTKLVKQIACDQRSIDWIEQYNATYGGDAKLAEHARKIDKQLRDLARDEY